MQVESVISKKESAGSCIKMKLQVDLNALLVTKLLQHNKRNHIDSVPTCKYMISETCKYGSKNCWFNHGEGETSTMNENDKKLNDTEVIEKYFK